MTEIPPRGCEPSSEPATYGGPGWKPRTASHLEEITRGEVWTPCGVGCETDPLASVLLSWPGDELGAVRHPDDWMMLDSVDLPVMRKQAEQIVAFYQGHGIEATLFRPPMSGPPNLIFMRDLFFMTPQGAVVSRMASRPRAGEERFASLALATIGVPILATIRDGATFEAADALWLDRRKVLLGYGFRTNSAGAAQVSGLLEELGVASLPVEMPPGAQHLLGVLNFVAPDFAVIREAKATRQMRTILEEHGISTLALSEDEEVVRRGAMNFVTLSPRRIAMPTDCPNTRRRYERAGIACEEIEVTEYLKAAGGLACLTGIVRRVARATV